KKQLANEAALLEDFSPTDFSGQPEEPMAASNSFEGKNASLPERETALLPEVALTADEVGDITVPDFLGRTMREVTELCLHLGLEPRLVGSNLAVAQYPEAGASLRRGARVTVQFGTPAPSSARAKGHVAAVRRSRSRR